MSFVSEIENRLHKYGLKVISDREMDYFHQFRLVSGAIINAYFNGKVVVQGKLDPRGKAEQVARLLKALPSHTKFPPSMVPEDATKSLVREHDGHFVDSESRWNVADRTRRIAVDISRPSQSRAIRVVTNLVLDERGEYVPDESRQANHDMVDPDERW